MTHLETYEVLEETIRRDTVLVAKACGRSLSLVGKWKEPRGDWTDSGAYNPLDRLTCIMDTIAKIDLERSRLPLKWLAARYGFVLVPLPRPGQEGTKELSARLLAAVKEFGELAEQSARALEDGSLDKDEARRILAEGYELQEAVGTFLHLVEKEAK